MKKLESLKVEVQKTLLNQTVELTVLMGADADDCPPRHGSFDDPFAFCDKCGLVYKDCDCLPF